MWTFKIMKNIEKSKGRRFDLGVDEKRLAFDSWRVISPDVTLRKCSSTK
jgi:hypothetical protein